MFFLAFWASGSVTLLVIGYGFMLLGWRPVFSRPIWVDALLWPVLVSFWLIELVIVFSAALMWAGNGVWEVLWDAVRPRGR